MVSDLVYLRLTLASRHPNLRLSLFQNVKELRYNARIYKKNLKTKILEYVFAFPNRID